MLSNLRHYLRISHLVGGFDTDYTSAEVVLIQSVFELALGLAGTKYENRLCVTNAGNHLVVVTVQLSGQLSLANIIRRRRHAGLSVVLFDIRADQLDFFFFAGNEHDHSLLVIDPQTHGRLHRLLLLQARNDNLIVD